MGEDVGAEKVLARLGASAEAAVTSCVSLRDVSNNLVGVNHKKLGKNSVDIHLELTYFGARTRAMSTDRSSRVRRARDRRSQLLDHRDGKFRRPDRLTRKVSLTEA